MGVDLKSKMEKVEGENAELNKIVNVDKVECGTQTDFAFILEDVHLKALQSENAYLMKELNLLIADRSRFKECVNYNVITGGKHDNSVRIWQPKTVGTSEVTFIPKRKAFVDGSVLSVGMSDDGILMAAGCSLKNTVNGYVVVWKLNDDGNVLCNLRSRTLLRFGKVHCVKFMKFENDNTSKRKKKGYKIKKSKNKNISDTGFNYLLFGGDTTGCILCWNLSSVNMQSPVCVISGHSDIIYDLS